MPDHQPDLAYPIEMGQVGPENLVDLRAPLILQEVEAAHHRRSRRVRTVLPGVVVAAVREAGQFENPPMLGVTQLSNYLTLKGSLSAVSKPNFASKYALESSRRDLQNALLCTVLESTIEKWEKKDLAKTTPKIGENKKTRGQ